MTKLDIKIKLTGGLGNQIFQYLAAKRLSKTFPTAAISFIPTDYITKGYRELLLKDIFDIRLSGMSNEPLLGRCIRSLSSRNSRIRMLYHKNYSLWGWRVMLCEEDMRRIGASPPLINVERIIGKNMRDGKTQERLQEVIIDGFWQDFLPLADCSDISTNLGADTLKREYPSLIPGEYIALHVRRGDYIEESGAHREFGCAYDSLSFIRNAFSLIPKHLYRHPLVICSDDLEWCRLWSSSDITKDFSSVLLIGSSSINDWLILQSSRLNICSNSTYSITAAILNKLNSKKSVRCIIPTMYTKLIPSREKNWHMIPGSILV